MDRLFGKKTPRRPQPSSSDEEDDYVADEIVDTDTAQPEQQSRNMQVAIQTVSAAIRADKQNNLPLAYKYYRSAIEMFLVELRTIPAYARPVMQRRVEGYMQRAEELNHRLHPLEDAKAHALKAIQFDGQNKLGEAYEHYKKAVEALLRAVAMPQNYHLKPGLLNRVDGYLRRAEELRQRSRSSSASSSPVFATAIVLPPTTPTAPVQPPSAATETAASRSGAPAPPPRTDNPAPNKPTPPPRANKPAITRESSLQVARRATALFGQLVPKDAATRALHNHPNDVGAAIMELGHNLYRLSHPHQYPGPPSATDNAAASSTTPPSDSGSSAVECVICLDEPRCMLMLPCAHLCVCENCALTVGDACPICRQAVTTKQKIFM